LGVELYGLQQELAKNQKLLEEKFDDYNDVNQGRKIVEEELDEIRKDYREQQQKYDDEMRKLRDLQSERDNLKLRIHHMSMHKDMIRGDIAVLRRATEKAETEKNKFEIEKQRQVRQNKWLYSLEEMFLENL
jgi:chromosome segregation ATPase